MSLSGQQRKRIQFALVSAFPTKPPLEQMLSFELDKKLDAITSFFSHATEIFVESQEQQINEARTQIRNLYGNGLAEKASDAFCLMVAGQAIPKVNSIIEFNLEDSINVETSEAATEIKRNTDEVAAEFRMSDSKARQWYATSRESRIIAERERFFNFIGSITAELESKNFARLPDEQVCWLNQSIRIIAEPKILAEVVQDPKIKKLDLPRPLQAEARTTSYNNEGTQYREECNLRGQDIIIAIIDSEVKRDHPAFQERVIQRYNFTTEDWGSPASHGTAVAGIAAANHQRMVGIAPEAIVYNYKVLDRSERSNDFQGSRAIQEALEDGAHIANCSWGTGKATGTTREVIACNRAWEFGMSIVKSAGNRGPNSSTLTNPAQADGIIVVGATDQHCTNVQSYSSRGPLDNGLPRPHLVAPGGTREDGLFCCLVGREVFGNQNGSGGFIYGTSLAAPYVSGLLALLLEHNPNLSPNQQRDMLLMACTSFENADANTQGKGFISLRLLWDSLQRR